LDAGSVEGPNGNDKVCSSGVYGPVTDYQNTLRSIELAIDIIYSIEIILCYVKKTIGRRYLK